jgi:hypothetical protein
MKLQKETYYIKWQDAWGVPHSDIVNATSISQAWTKTKWRHPFSTDFLTSIMVLTEDGWREL